jgi:hypothetical protein
MSEPHYASFEEFWPFYVRAHSKKATRTLHFLGVTASMACLAGGLLTKRRWLLAAMPVAGYGPAWIGHFFVENNRPATFTYPLWSLRGDLLMWWRILAGGMDEEIRLANAAQAADEASHVEPPPEPVRPRRDTLN